MKEGKSILKVIVNYLAMQVILIFSKGKHLDLEAFDVRGILNSGIDPNGMEDHLVWVSWVWTAGTEKEAEQSLTLSHL